MNRKESRSEGGMTSQSSVEGDGRDPDKEVYESIKVNALLYSDFEQFLPHNSNIKQKYVFKWWNPWQRI